ncbi:MAG: response regulator [Patescibacteria group bacterium]|jgi:DNA-binding response OmpR family regulator
MSKNTSNKGQRKASRILLVEDDSFLAGMYVTKLTLEGLSVELATDGAKGLKMAQEMKPDIILLDIILPKMSGFDVLKKLRENKETKDVPILLLTNLGQKEDVEKGLKLGATDYLIKAHFLPDEVVTKIIATLKGKKS